MRHTRQTHRNDWTRQSAKDKSRLLPRRRLVHPFIIANGWSDEFFHYVKSSHTENQDTLAGMILQAFAKAQNSLIIWLLVMKPCNAAYMYRHIYM